MEELSILTALSRSRAPGPSPSFGDYHLLWTIDIIAFEAPVGRSRLSEILGLGEGVGRTIVERLREEGLIEVSRSGCSLTDRGKDFLETVRGLISRPILLTGSPIGFGRFNMAILVINASQLVRSGIEERDVSIRAGALGAMTLIFKNNTLRAPGLSNDAGQDFPEITDQLLGKFQPAEGDVILIVAADGLAVAEQAVRAAALSLFRGKRSKSHSVK